MARTHNPFAAAERSKVHTPWGDYEIAPPNKHRLAIIEDLQTAAQQLEESDASTLEESVRLGMRSAAAGVERGDELLVHLEKAWDDGELTLDQVRSLAEFVGSEIAGEASEGND
jgi:hypothetical protein